MQTVALWMNPVAVSWAKRAVLACGLLLGATGVASADVIATWARPLVAQTAFAPFAMVRDSRDRSRLPSPYLMRWIQT